MAAETETEIPTEYSAGQTLRPYQLDAIDALRRSVRSGHRAPLLVSPTGSGKTIIFAALIEAVLAKGGRALVFAPRRELIIQASRTLDRHDIFHGIIMRGERLKPHPVQVASWDSFRSWKKRGKIEPPPADLILIDEAHLSLSATRYKILKEVYPDVIRIGLTATPARGDGRPLGDLFDDMVIGSDIPTLTRDGFLVPLKYYAPSVPDLAGLKIVMGDYHAPSIEKRFDVPKIVGDVVENFLRIAPTRRAVVFAATIAHAHHLAERFNESGIKADAVDCHMSDEKRKSVLWKVEQGITQVICNVGILSLGWDLPAISCAVLARPTKSLVYYFQTVGRVLRPCEGKQDAILIDHGGVIDELGFVDEPVPWTLAGKERVQVSAKEYRKKSGEETSIRCGGCGYVYKRSKQCPECGWEPPAKKEAFQVYDGELVELTKGQRANNRKYTAEDKARFYGQLKMFCIEKNFKPGFAAHKYREKFGVWPNKREIRDCMPVPIDEEMRNWIKSRFIAAAKRKEKR